MDWIKQSAIVNVNDKPRFLTDNDINNTLVNYLNNKNSNLYFPDPPGADKASRELARQCTVDWIISELKKIQLSPSLVPKLLYKIIQAHYKSLITPGTPIAIGAGHAVGATTTQMTLNTFHLSGSAVSASFSIDALRDIIYARKVPKNEGCTIYYKNKYITYEEALATRRYIVGTLVSDLVSDFDIDTPENIKGGKKWWSDANELYDNQLPNSTLVMRLFLNVVEMYKQKVTIKELADVLEREVTTKTPSIVVRYGPISDGIIDIYPSDQIKKTINETLYKTNKASQITEINTLAESTYLESIVYPELKNIRVKGIKGLRNLYPRTIKVWDIVLSERKDVGDKWLLTLHQDKMYLHGLDHNNIIKLCESAKLKIDDFNNDNIIVSMPNDRFRTTNNDLVIDISGIKYRNIDFSNINDDLSTLRVIEGMLYEEIDEKLIKTKADNYYEIEIEEKTKKSVGPNRWIEEEVPAKLMRVDIINILPLQKKIYIKVNNLYSIKNDVIIPLYDLNIKDKILYSGNDTVTNLYQDLSNLIRLGKIIKELKPSEYVNNKITEAKKSYQDEVTKRTNEIIESSTKEPQEIRESKEIRKTRKIVYNTVAFPKYGLKSKVPYDDIPYEDTTKVLFQNNVEFGRNKEENLVKIQDLILQGLFALDPTNLPQSIQRWIDNGGWIKTGKIGEDEVLVEEVEEGFEDVIVEEEKTVKMKIPVNRDRPKILKLSEFVVADVEIIAPAKDLKIRVPMFRNLLGLHFIDKQRTTCNNMHTLTNVFGIETARTFIIMRLHDIIKSNSSYVHPAHIIFIAEFITSRGVPFGTTFTGISRQPGGHLSLATVERAGKTLTQHALHGRKEDIRNVSASISVGQRMVIGNGMFDIAQDVVEDNKSKTLINDDVFTAHKRDETETEEIEEEENEIVESKEEITYSDIPELEPLRSDPDVTIDYVDRPVLKKVVFGKTKKQIEEFKAVISEGLVILTDLEPSDLGNALPESLLIYFDKYSL